MQSFIKSIWAAAAKWILFTHKHFHCTFYLYPQCIIYARPMPYSRGTVYFGSNERFYIFGRGRRRLHGERWTLTLYMLPVYRFIICAYTIYGVLWQKYGILWAIFLSFYYSFWLWAIGPSGYAWVGTGGTGAIFLRCGTVRFPRKKRKTCTFHFPPNIKIILYQFFKYLNCLFFYMRVSAKTGHTV